MDDFSEMCLTTPRARVAFREQVARTPPAVVLYNTDVDGMASAALWQRAAMRVHWPTPQLWHPPRPGHHGALPPTGLTVALGGVSTLSDTTLRLAAEPAACTGVWQSLACTSVWLWELWQELADVQDLDWLAALGCAHVGRRVAVPWLQAVRSRCTPKFLRAAARLVSAAARASHFAPEVALQALMEHNAPRDLVQTSNGTWQAMAAEVDDAFEQGKRANPYLCGRLVAIGMRQRCRVEDWLASHWLGAFPNHVVLVGNEGYAPGLVCYAAAAGCGMRARDFLASVGWPQEYAASGCMPVATWHQLLQRLQVPSGELLFH